MVEARRAPRPKSAGRLAVVALALAAGALAVVGGASCLSRRDAPRGSPGEDCAACHGDSSRAGDELLRAAPPRDLSGGTSVHHAGVGAHSIHLLASATHAAFACTECHVVPERVDSPGHADDAAPAELVFGELARKDGHHPSYDAVARRCDNSYCHRSAEAVWTEPRSSSEACGSCHGLPPPAPHPSSTLCSTCHGDVIDAAGKLTAPSLHVDGKVQLRATSCTQCHGRGDEPSPPRDVEGHDAITALGVGAHEAHLSGGAWSRPLACQECHDVPESADDFEHADGLPAEVALRGVAATGAREPRWDRGEARCVDSWCHGPGAAGGATSPRWNRPAQLDCSSCHGSPPPAPHPQMTDCSRCHGAVVGSDDVTIVDRLRHVDGHVDVDVDQTCTSCHGAKNAAPPRNVDGDSSTSARGVGAHQTHVLGTARSRAVACGECHVVPQEVLTPGHTDTPPPAEVALSGPANAFGGTARLSAGRCVDSSCHGAVFPSGHQSGGSLTTPSWAVVDGTQAACGTCHALPPPRPHPYFAEDCGRCHKDLSPDGKSFLRPELHVDGVVTFELP
jgi:predicted CxxxxCH...CXXCH cytochrome family protein